ncbi:MAG: rod shape-determining protein MreD [Proteobacteria bacterium]|nr:rod shape-determining protein MreD [Pseudomonadota bacterium]
MTFFIYTLFILCLILIQTVVLPFFFHVVSSYDLMMIFILYLGFYRPLAEGIPLLIGLGAVMDCFSGGPFGMYLTTYVWMYAATKAIIQYLHVDSRIVLPVAILAGVILENMIVLLTVSLGRSTLALSYAPVEILFYQAVWALLTGPVIFLLIKAIHHGVGQWFKMHVGSDKNRDEFQY